MASAASVWARVRNLPPRRTALLSLIAGLGLLAVGPPVLEWRLISAYAAIPVISAPAERTISVQRVGFPPLRDLRSLVAGDDGTLFVIDGANGRVLRLSGNIFDPPVVVAQDGSPLRAGALTLGANGSIFALDSVAGTISQVAPSGEVLSTRSRPVLGASSIAVDAAENVFVGDPRGGMIHKFLADGTADLRWGDRRGAASAARVGALTFVGDTLYAATDSEVLRLDSQGRITARRRPPGAPLSLAALSGDLVAVSDARSDRIWMLDRELKVAGRLAERSVPIAAREVPRALSTAGSQLYIAYANRIVVRRVALRRAAP
ncbi:MAG: hypothetical protein HY534_05380 [Chloroflexi bacterium]|nr:hypothetical protein [Chloroflexota bacterium]